MQRPPVILAILIVQIVCAVFFVGEMLNSMFGFVDWSISWTLYEFIEIGASFGLIIGVMLGGHQLREGWRRTAKAEMQLAALSVAFWEMIVSHFDRWQLTTSERDVALFLIKGLSNAEIAKLRQTSEGTVKAQSSAIYTKADVTSRAQLVGLLIDDLMQDELFANDAPTFENSSG